MTLLPVFNEIACQLDGGNIEPSKPSTTRSRYELFLAPGVPAESVPVYAAHAMFTFAPPELEYAPFKFGCILSRDGPVPSVLESQPLLVSVALAPSSKSTESIVAPLAFFITTSSPLLPRAPESQQQTSGYEPYFA